MSDQTSNWKAEVARISEVVVGCQLVAGKTLPELTTGDFIDVRHSRIWAAMLELEGEGFVPDLSLVSERLGSKGELELVGGYSYLAYLAQMVIGVQQVQYYVRIVKEAVWKHDAANLGHRLFMDVEEGKMSAAEALGKARAAMEALEARMGESNKAERTLSDLYNQMAQGEAQTEALCTLPSIPGWVERAGPIMAGDEILVAMPSKTGKTFTGLIMAKDMADAGHVGMYFSLEVGWKKIARRMALLQQGINIDRAHKLTDWQVDKLKELAGLPTSGRIIISDQKLTARQIMDKIRSTWQRLREAGIALRYVVIDHITMMSTGSDSNKVSLELERIASDFAALGTELDMAVIILSQVTVGELRWDELPKVGNVTRNAKGLVNAASVGVLGVDLDIVLNAPGKGLLLKFDALRDVEQKNLPPLILTRVYESGGYIASEVKHVDSLEAWS
jgi:replicative DNA helicase